MKWCFRFLKRLVSLPHTMLLRLWQTVFSVCLLLWMSMQPALADLPTMEPPSSGGGSGLFGQIKGYSQDGVVLGGLGLLSWRIPQFPRLRESRKDKKPGRSLGPLWWWG